MAKRSVLKKCKFLFNLLKIFGVATMTIDEHFNFKTSKSGLVYNVLLIILVLIGTYFAMDLAYFLDFAERGQLERITDTIQTVFVITTSLFILIVHCVRQESVVKIGNDLRQSIHVSSTLCCKKTYEDKSKKTLKAIKSVISFNVAITSFWLIATPTISKKVFLYFASVTLCNFIINALMMQYTVVLTIISHLFDVLNTSITEITNNKTEQLEISFVQKYGLQMKLNKLSRCRDFFSSISRLSRDISKFMETIMLVCIANTFLTIIIYGYYMMKPIIVGKNVVATSIMIRAAAQLSFSIVSTVLLTKASSSAVNQSKRTGEIVNECLYKEGCSCHPDVEKQLNVFSNYLLHANVRFVVCNLFSLDETLLMSISGSITTYLVILLQFKQGDAP